MKAHDFVTGPKEMAHNEQSTAPLRVAAGFVTSALQL
jgi:hypothetical protein